MMCMDFTQHKFTHTLYLIFMILVSLENVKKYSHVIAWLPQRLKSMLFEIFSTLRVPFEHPPFEKISNNIDFSIWDNQCICPVKMRPKSWKSNIVRKSAAAGIILNESGAESTGNWFHSEIGKLYYTTSIEELLLRITRDQLVELLFGADKFY